MYIAYQKAMSLLSSLLIEHVLLGKLYGWGYRWGCYGAVKRGGSPHTRLLQRLVSGSQTWVESLVELFFS